MSELHFRDARKRLPGFFFALNALLLAALFAFLSLRYTAVPESDGWSAPHYGFLLLYAFSNYFLISLAASIVPGIFARFGLIRISLALVFVADGAALALFLADTFVYQQFRLHTNAAMLEMALLGDSGVVGLSGTVWLEAALLAAACFAASLLIILISRRASRRRLTIASVAVPMAFLFLACNVWHGWSYATHRTSFTAVSDMLPLTSPLHFNRVLVRSGIATAEDVYSDRLAAAGVGSGMNYPLHPLSYSGGGRMNIIFIYVDALRFDMLNEDTMPNAWRFAKGAVRFDDHWSGGVNTRHGIFTVFTGLSAHYWQKALATRTPSVLVRALRERDYAIGTFAGATLRMPEFSQTIFAGVPDLRLDPRGETTLERDETLIEDFFSWADGLPQGKPFFGFLFFNNVHGYAFPEDAAHTHYRPYWEKVNQLELGWNFERTPFLNRYKNAVRHADDNIGRVLDYLRKKGLDKNSVIVISSDHGEEFNDGGQNYWSHNGNFTAWQAKVPLVISWPGKKPGVVSNRTSALDIVPTILPGVLGVTNPVGDYSSGMSLWDDGGRAFLFCSTYTKDAFIEKDRVVIVNQAGVLEVVDSANRRSSDRSAPAYLDKVLEEMTKFMR